MRRKAVGILSRLILLLTVLTVVMFSSETAFASNCGINPDAAGTLVIKEKEASTDEAISGLKVLLYKIGDIDCENIAIVPAEKYAKLPVDFSNLDTVQKQFSIALAGKKYIEENNITEERFAYTDSKGEAYFDSLPVGLYLVAFEGDAEKLPNSFLVQMPVFDEETNEYNYDIEAFPKSSSVDGLTSKIVVKIWDDENNKAGKRSDSVTAELYCDGKLYASAELSEANNWTYTWDTLDKSCEWTVKEKGSPSGYVSTVTYSDGQVVVKNTYTSGKLPQTGQNYIIVLALFACGVVLVTVGAAIYAKSSSRKKKY